jgi:hypothetical protein
VRKQEQGDYGGQVAKATGGQERFIDLGLFNAIIPCLYGFSVFLAYFLRVDR